MDEPAKDLPAPADVVATRTFVLTVAAILFAVWWGWTSFVRPPSETAITHQSKYGATICTVTEPRAADVWSVATDVEVQCDFPCSAVSETYPRNAAWTGTVRVHRSLTGWSAWHAPIPGFDYFCGWSAGAP